MKFEGKTDTFFFSYLFLIYSKEKVLNTIRGIIQISETDSLVTIARDFSELMFSLGKNIIK